MKRFTETNKWDKPWFHDLPPHLKCLWLYMCDKADGAGVWEPNWKIASMFIGKTVTAADLKSLGDRVSQLPGGKVWISGFVGFQYGRLSRECRPHLKIFESLAKHGLDYTPDHECVIRTRVGSVSQGKRRHIYERDGHACIYCRSTESLEPDHIVPRSKGGLDEIRNLVTACHACNTMKNDKSVEDFVALNPEKERILKHVHRVLNTPADRDKEQDKDTDKEEEPEKEPPVAIPENKARGTVDEIKTLCAEEGLPLTDATWFFNKCEGNGWQNNGKPIKDWKATVRAWKAAGYMPSQKVLNGRAPNGGLPPVPIPDGLIWSSNAK